MPQQERKIYQKRMVTAGGFVAATTPSSFCMKATSPSGGTVTRFELTQFLSSDSNSPEKQALLEMIGGLAQRRD
jgi:hypothetical protein